jgi:uncharacterized membrane protein (DUF373 family)
VHDGWNVDIVEGLLGRRGSRSDAGMTAGAERPMEQTPEPASPLNEKIIRGVSGFARFIAFILILLLMVVVTLTTTELAVLIVRGISRATRTSLLDVEQMLELYGAFLLVLVGMELLTSLKTYVRHGSVDVEVVLEVALVALAQKIIILEPSVSPMKQFGLAALILALAAAFWWVHSTRHPRAPTAAG